MEMPNPPAGKTAAFKSAWNRIWETNDALTLADYYAVNDLCSLMVARDSLDKSLKGEQVKLEINGGTNFMVHPAFKARMDVHKEIANLMAQLGMTPASRAKIGLQTESTDEVLDFLRAEQEAERVFREEMRASRESPQEDNNVED